MGLPHVILMTDFCTYHVAHVCVNSLRQGISPSIFPCANLLDCSRVIQRMLAFVSHDIFARTFGEYVQSVFIILFSSLYNKHSLLKRAYIKFV